MSNIVIDTSEVSLETQIRLAWESCVLSQKPGATNTPHDMFRDFAAGKFSKLPMPEIRKPKCVDCAVVLQVAGALPPQFMVVANGLEGMRIWGPYKPTEREAIFAFNDLFGGAP